MKNYKQILEAINRGINMALDDFDDNEDLIGQQTQTIKDTHETKELIQTLNHPYLAKGKKLRMNNWRELENEAYIENDNSSKKTPKYLKYIIDNCVDRVLWKYPEFVYSNTEVNKIQYSTYNPDWLVDEIIIWYTYRGTQIGFRVNTRFSNIFVMIYFKVNGKRYNITWSLFQRLDIILSSIFEYKENVKIFKNFLDTIKDEDKLNEFIKHIR